MADQRTCFCGCGKPTKDNEVWVRGHEAKALQELLTWKYGDTRGFLEAHGFGPGKRNLYEELIGEDNDDAPAGRRRNYAT